MSDVYECGNQYVVAMLSEVNENEYRPMADVRGELMLMAMNNKKAKVFNTAAWDLSVLAYFLPNSK